MGPRSSDQPHLSANHRWLCSFICWPCGLTTDFVMRQDELDSFEVRCPDCPRNMELRSTEPFDDDSWSEEEFTDEDSDHDGDGGAPGGEECLQVAPPTHRIVGKKTDQAVPRKEYCVLPFQQPNLRLRGKQRPMCVCGSCQARSMFSTASSPAQQPRR